MNRNRRDRQIQRYIQTVSNTLEATSQGESPLPAVLIRLGDGVIIWANHRFSELTGYADTMMEQQLEEVLPDFPLDWLEAGKTECPRDASLGDRRYRVYGTTVRAEDNRGTMLGALYFSDLTELYQIRDEYIRSRPVIAIILIDNYEELTKNLTESAISSMNARLNETITQWTEGYGGLLRSWSATGSCLFSRSGICSGRWTISFPCWNPSTRLPTPPACPPPFLSAWAWTEPALTRAMILRP